MRIEPINIDQLASSLQATYEGDYELVKYFDPGCAVSTWQDCCDAIEQKIKIHYPLASIRCVLDEDFPVGYYIIEKDMLISFGVRLSYRNREWLSAFWKKIKEEFHGPFSCLLYSNNTRAISWLQNSGMKLLFDNVTILTLCPQEDLV